MSSRFDIYKDHGCKLCSCRTKNNELSTRQGLALTPADVSRLTSQGMPVNVDNARMFYDGEPNPTPYVTSERRRGVDVAELWERHQQIINRAREAHKKMKQSKQS